MSKSLEVQKQAHLEALRILYKKDLFKFCQIGLGYAEMTRAAHQHMVDALSSQTRRKLLVLPRGCFKSSIGVIGYSIWRLINDPNLRILIESEVYTNSKNFLREIKAHTQTKRFIQLFGDWKTDNWNESEITISTRNRNLKESSIVVGSYGSVKVSTHFDLIINDDMNSGNNSETPEGCEKVIRHYQLNQAILEPSGTYVVIGTRYHVMDLIGFLLDNEIDEVKNE